jgi:hypothetical protein
MAAQSPFDRRAHYITAEEGQKQEKDFPMPPLESSSGDEREDGAGEAPLPIMERVRVMTDQQARALETLRFLAGPRRPWLQEELLEEDRVIRDVELAFKKRLETQQKVPEEEDYDEEESHKDTKEQMRDYPY